MKPATSKPRLTPKLRFPEFRDAPGWEACALEELAEFVGDRVSVSELNRADYVSTENLLPDFGGRLPPSSFPAGGSVIRYRKNDILAANIRPYLKKIWLADSNGGASNDVIVIRAQQTVGHVYLSHVLKNDHFVAYVMSGAKGLKMPRGDISLIRQYPVPIPSPPEQQKIASCLSSLDDLIAAERQQLDALKAHKKGLMQQLFPRVEGASSSRSGMREQDAPATVETRPRLRFPEFRKAPEWESHELGPKSIKVGSGITPTGGDKNYKRNGRPFMRSQNVGWGVLLLDDIVFIDEDTHRSFSSTEIAASDVLLNITGASIGRSAIADERIFEGNVNQHVCIIRVIAKELQPVFLNQYLLSQNGQKQIDSFQAGGNRQGLNFAQIRSFSIALPPTLNEQHMVAACLSSLDDLIAAQSDKLEALKTHKKGLMQQLFPAVDGGEG